MRPRVLLLMMAASALVLPAHAAAEGPPICVLPEDGGVCAPSGPMHFAVPPAKDCSRSDDGGDPRSCP